MAAQSSGAQEQAMLLAKMRQQHASELENERTTAAKQVKLITDEFYQQSRLMLVLLHYNVYSTLKPYSCSLHRQRPRRTR